MSDQPSHSSSTFSVVASSGLKRVSPSETQQERISSIMSTISFYNSAPASLLNADFIERFDEKQRKQISNTAAKRLMRYNSLEVEEKVLVKSKVKKGVIFNVGLICAYKFSAHPSVQAAVTHKHMRLLLNSITFKKGMGLALLSPLLFLSEFQEVTLRLGVKHWLLQTNPTLEAEIKGQVESTSGTALE